MGVLRYSELLLNKDWEKCVCVAGYAMFVKVNKYTLSDVSIRLCVNTVVTSGWSPSQSVRSDQSSHNL